MRLVTTLLALAVLASPALADPLALDPQLEVFTPFIGKTFRGEVVQPGSVEVAIDVQHWERILNGKALRITHSINDGEYGGEVIYFWDSSKESLVYYYFTTAGFHTQGTAVVNGDGSWTAHEFVEGSSGGITEARSSGEVRDDGSLATRAEYRIDGEWKPGRSALYHEAPDAKVIFR